MEVSLRNAMFAHFDAAATSMGLPVVWPKVKVTESDKPTSDYLQISVLPVNAQIEKTCGDARHLWLLQALICIPTGRGEIVAAEYAQQLRNLTPYGARLTNGGHSFDVVSRGDLRPSVELSGWDCYPLLFKLQSFD